MNTKLRAFLNSDILEKYVLGSTTEKENLKAEKYLAKYPEAQEEYEILQEQLEISARSEAIEVPEQVLKNVLKTLDESSVIHFHRPRRVSFWYGAAASVIALIFAGTSYFFYNNNKSLVDENNTIADEIFDLRSDIENNNEKLDAVMYELLKLNNPETQKYVLRGNENAKDLKTVAIQ